MLRTYRNLLDKHILPYMGGMSLQEMTTNSIQHFFNEHAYMAQSTARQMRILLHEICAAAVEDGYLAKDPTCSKRLILPGRLYQRRIFWMCWQICRGLRLKMQRCLRC